MTFRDDTSRFELVADAVRFAELGPAWTALWESAGASVFQSHGWIAAWWRTRDEAEPLRLRIGLLWSGPDLVAILPLVLRRHRGVRVLEWAAKEQSDYCGALVCPGPAGAERVRAAWTGVVDAGGFDLAYLSHLRPESGMAWLVEAPGRQAPGGLALRPGHRGETSLRVQSGWPSGEAWLNSLSKKARQNHRRSWKALEEVGQPRFRLCAPDEPLGPVLDRLAALKTEWLARTGQTSPILERGAAPLRAAVEALRSAGLLRLFVLECDGTLVAGTVNFVEERRMSAFFAAYDHALERASLGTMLMAEYMKWAFDAGLDEVDFLCGAEEYKRRFANSEVELGSVVGARTLLGAAACWLDRWAPAARARAAGLARWRPARTRRDPSAAPLTSGTTLQG